MMMTPSKQPSRVTIPKHAHPIAKVIFRLMQEQRISYEELSYYSGVHVTTFKSWRQEKLPSLSTADACLGCFGWRILPVPPLDQLPPKIRPEVEALARQWGSSQPILTGLIAALAEGYPDPLGTIHNRPAPSKRAAPARAGRPPRAHSEQMTAA